MVPINAPAITTRMGRYPLPTSTNRGCWARSGHCPSQSKQSASKEAALPGLGVFVELERLAVGTLPFVLAREENKGCTEHYRGTNDAIHVEAFKAEHLVYAVPRNGLALGHKDAKKDPDQQKLEVLYGLQVEQVRQNEPTHDQTSGEKADDGNKRWPLQIAQP